MGVIACVWVGGKGKVKQRRIPGRDTKKEGFLEKARTGRAADPPRTGRPPTGQTKKVRTFS
jgi:hypothetical protein